MLEQYCCEKLRNMCRDIVDKHDYPRIKLRTDTRKIPENPYENYMGEYKFLWLRSVYDYGKGKRRLCNLLARKYFDENSQSLISFFLFDMHGCCIETAMNKTENFETLWSQFLLWFDQKRRDFRMTFNITDSKKQILENGKRPNSHGGVANLLKVLTKTMEKQGASIENIAKVQYTICMQAGIYIPDEFIEDVAIALYIEDGEKRNE